MPERVTAFYKLSGWFTSIMYSESEMGEALGLDNLPKLHSLIERGFIYYSVHPKANHKREYEFSQAVYDLNKKLWACLQSGGHNFEFEKFYDLERGKKKYKCSSCPAEKYD